MLIYFFKYRDKFVHGLLERVSRLSLQTAKFSGNMAKDCSIDFFSIILSFNLISLKLTATMFCFCGAFYLRFVFIYWISRSCCSSFFFFINELCPAGVFIFFFIISINVFVKGPELPKEHGLNISHFKKFLHLRNLEFAEIHSCLKMR